MLLMTHWPKMSINILKIISIVVLLYRIFIIEVHAFIYNILCINLIWLSEFISKYWMNKKSNLIVNLKYKKALAKLKQNFIFNLLSLINTYVHEYLNIKNKEIISQNHNLLSKQLSYFSNYKKTYYNNLTNLSVNLSRFNFSYEQHLGFESAILYWHFVDIVWIVLVYIIYWNGILIDKKNWIYNQLSIPDYLIINSKITHLLPGTIDQTTLDVWRGDINWTADELKKSYKTTKDVLYLNKYTEPRFFS